VVWPQNHWDGFSQFGFKTGGDGFSRFGSQNWWQRVSRFGTQNQQLQFGDLGLKITATVSWFDPQNQAGYDLLVAPQNWQEDEDDVGHASRSSSLLHVEASRARVPQFASKLVEARWWVVHVAPSRRLRGDEVEDGWIDGLHRILLPLLCRFHCIRSYGHFSLLFEL
jgi:hypothetical protein